MALYHFHVGQIKRSAGRSAVECAAYRAGEKLYSEYYGQVSDYTRKGGVIHAEILLQPHAPRGYDDRQTLWNAVEEVERNKNAQLAYSFDIALQNEFTMEENIELARKFLLDNFISRDMIADFAVHRPDKENGIANLHFHVMCPIRPLNHDGTWGAKQRRVNCEGGKFDAVPTTDWGKPETLEAWRETWAAMCNAKFEEKSLPCRIDHRSYKRQGIEQIPTVHEGVAVQQMEAKGIVTDKGEHNRWIRSATAMLRKLGERIKTLVDWLNDARSKLDKPHSPSLGKLLADYFDARNAGAWSNKAKVGNLKRLTSSITYLEEKNLHTLGDLEARLDSLHLALDELKTTLDANKKRSKELHVLLRYADQYKRFKPLHEQLIAIKWRPKRERFKAEHESELKQFYLSRRKLPDGSHIAEWQRELATLERENDAAYAEYKALRAELTKLMGVKYCVDRAMGEREERGRETRPLANERD
ncbi:MAG TPA: MobA/MobL family protein [Candidatus Scatomorpha gallistercoris]|nr:MobA/MobL family protein [Candidatus Scatomorpha gallistercoris]